MRWRRLASAFGALLVVAAGTGDAADNLKAEFRVRALEGPGKPRLGSSVEVTLRYQDLTTGRTVADVEPAVWLRRGEPDQMQCRDAARSFRITRALSRTDVPLFGVWLGIFGGGNTLSLIDPKVEYQGSNLVSVAPLGGRLLHIEHDAPTHSLLVAAAGREAQRLSLPNLSAKIPLAAEPWGEFARLADGGWIAERQETGELLRLAASGERLSVVANGKSPWRLKPVAGSHRFAASIIAVDAVGASVWLDAESGEEIARAGLPQHELLAAAPGLFAAASANESTLAIRYRDAPQHVINIALGLRPEGISMAADGSYSLVWSNTEGKAELVDLAFSKSVQGFEFGEPGISSAKFSGSTLFIGHGSGLQISIADLLPRRNGGEALLRGYSLGSAAHTGAVIIQGLGDSGDAIAFEKSGELLFMLNGEAGHPNPIMGTIPLKGTTAEEVFVFDRGLVRQEDGSFAGVVQLPDRGPLELVATTGTGGTTACHAIETEGPAAPQPREPVLEYAGGDAIASGTPVELRFSLRELPDGKEIPASIPAMILALSGNYARPVELVRQRDGTFAATIRFPAKGVYPLVIDQGSAFANVNPVVIEVTR